ncbi:hypothetical protein KUCAC02_019283 [Chaenocephalus aceratus]|nr:hypothetical protein KUCAC02_019283 [Chaenocephalus aceratus]
MVSRLRKNLPFGLRTVPVQSGVSDPCGVRWAPLRPSIWSRDGNNERCAVHFKGIFPITAIRPCNGAKMFPETGGVWNKNRRRNTL